MSAGVELDIVDEAAVREAFDRIRRSLAAKAKGARFEGVAVQPMAKTGIRTDRRDVSRRSIRRDGEWSASAACWSK